jgi:hypothetical protein
MGFLQAGGLEQIPGCGVCAVRRNSASLYGETDRVHLPAEENSRIRKPEKPQQDCAG